MQGQMGDPARRLLAALCALAIVVGALPGTSWTATPTDPDLAAGDYALVQVAHGAADAVAAKAVAAGATDVAALDKLDLVTARLSTDALRSLQADSRVSYLAADAMVTASGEDHYEKGRAQPSPYIQVIDADEAWDRATGRGVTVALMDTGIAEHPDLEDSVVARKDFVNDGATLLDPSGHGTFVAGLIAAHGETFRGVAPDAKLVSLRVLDQRGNGTMHAVLAAFDWLLQNRAAMHIKVLNLSFGAPQRSSYHRELLAGVVESAWFAGVTVVAAAGNAGPHRGTITMPGADPFVITVGSFEDQGTVELNDDRESEFSSRGPTRDGFAKPDVLAPGEHIVSLRVPGTAMDRDGATISPNGAYARLSGTSASTAMAAGAAADVLEARRGYSPTQVKGALIAAGRKIVGTKTPGLDVDDALYVRPARVNAGLQPSAVLLRLLAASGNVFGPGTSWEGISWEGISWESVSWEGVAWEAVSWEGVTWDSVSWELP